MTQNFIEKSIELKAPIARVWRALTDYREFGEWFRVRLDAPFVVGQISRGWNTYPGHEHKWEVTIKEMVAEQLFSFTWHPCAIDPEIDFSGEEPTLVEFKLTAIAGGTLLTVIESGFDKLPAQRCLEALRMNQIGWGIQMENIKEYVSRKP
jgi:uncharacterized protein YndB with AHSA1/START domain